MLKRFAAMGLVVALMNPIVALGQAMAPPFSGTAFLDPSIIRDTDATAFTGLQVIGTGTRRNFDRRTNEFSEKQVRLFRALYEDNRSIEVQVNAADFGVVEAYNAATTYARSVGLLPLGVRRSIKEIVVHKGDQVWGGGLTETLIHTGRYAEEYVLGGFMEEIMMHEAAHTTLDTTDLVVSPAWQAAQRSDPTFISTYARDNPLREDVAESFTAWFAVRYRAERIPADMKSRIEAAIPARLAVFDSLFLDPNPVLTRATESDNYWITGLGPIFSRQLTIPDALFSTGAAFGSDFRPGDVKRTQWGSITVDFTSCTTARLSWSAKDPKFGSGSYDLVRLATNEQQRLCERNPSASAEAWASGTWFGGPARSGEGIFIDVLANGQAFLAWFTYGPRRPQ